MLRDTFRRGAASARTELPPYYARRLEAVGAPSRQSVRRQSIASDPEAEARRIFRDFKLGLVTLVVIALVLVAYFWEGDAKDGKEASGAEEGVLSFTVPCRPRGDVLPLAPPRIGPDAADRRAASASPRARPARREGSRAARPLPDGRRPSAARDRTRAGLRAAGAGGWVYSVRPGDTLSAIALRFYGDAAEWKVILQANRSRLRRPSDLRAGMRIVVPASPAEVPGLRSRSPVARGDRRPGFGGVGSETALRSLGGD
jgi:nucleoid-associated protein YgaU